MPYCSNLSNCAVNEGKLMISGVFPLSSKIFTLEVNKDQKISAQVDITLDISDTQEFVNFVRVKIEVNTLNCHDLFFTKNI